LLQWIPRFSDAHAMLLWAGLAGLIGALATIAFRDSLAALQFLLVGHKISLVEMAETLPWQMRIVLPCAGGMVAGVFLVLAKRYASGPSSEYMEAITAGTGRISVRQTLLRSLSSLFTIASGGSIGREGSMVQLAAMCASVIGRITKFEPGRLRLLVACGAAAGITSAYNAPIASAFFVTEIVLGTIVTDSLGPIMIAAVVANITMREFPGYKPTYEMPVFPAVSNAEVVLFIILGVIAGLAAPQFLRLLDFAKQLFKKSHLPVPLRLGLGGVLVGTLSVWVPQVWGNGYSVVNSLLHEPWLWQTVLVVLVFKIVATAFTSGSGAVGGTFTPTLFVGAAIGSLFGHAMHGLWPDATSAPFAYAIVGMGAFLAAATHAPLMAILMIFEMTLSYQVMLPLMLACVVAYFIARSATVMSMYEVRTRRSLDEEARLRLRSTLMRDLIKPAETVVPMSATLNDMAVMFRQHPVKYLYVIDDAQRYQGVAALQDLTSEVMDDHAAGARQAKDLLRRDFLPVITPEMQLDEALQCFLQHQGERLPAVKSKDDPVLLGVVFKTALLKAYFHLNQTEFLEGNLKI
jgi:CIC family chloride channel protein